MRLAAVLGVMLTTACAATAGQSQASSTSPWTVTFQLSGGIAGVMRTLTVSNTGAVTAEDSRRPGRVSGQATPDELKAIAAFVAAEVPASQSRSASCRDCLLYELEVNGGRRSGYQFDDATLTGSVVEPVVRTLVTILNRTLTPVG
jgi:hypothetical protein